MDLKILTILVTYLACTQAGHHSQHHLPVQSYRWIDLTYALSKDTVLFPGMKILFRTEYEGEWEHGDWLASRGFCISEHTGTHIDAPYHFNKNGRTSSDIPLEDMLDVPGVCIDVYDKIHKFHEEKLEVISNYVVTKKDLIEWEQKNGIIPAGSVVLLRTGWGERWPNVADYLGIPLDKRNSTDLNFIADPGQPFKFGLDLNTEAGRFLSFPGFDASAAKFLASERNVHGVGIDTASLDAGNDRQRPAHKIFMKNNMFLLENVANLHTLPATGFKVYVVPFKVDKGTGAPTRVLAKLPIGIKSHHIED